MTLLIAWFVMYQAKMAWWWYLIAFVAAFGEEAARNHWRKQVLDALFRIEHKSMPPHA